MRTILFFMAAFGILFTSCSSEESADVCVSFDVRQCNTDPWIEDRSSFDFSVDDLSIIKSYIESQGVNVKDIGMDINFHQIVCEACTVCPAGPRVYVKTSASDADKIKDLDLLNFESLDCSTIF